MTQVNLGGFLRGTYWSVQMDRYGHQNGGQRQNIIRSDIYKTQCGFAEDCDNVCQEFTVVYILPVPWFSCLFLAVNIHTYKTISPCAR